MNVTDAVAKIAEEIKGLLQSVTETRVKVDALDKAIDRLREDQREFTIVQRGLVESLTTKCLELEQRLCAIEGRDQAIFRESVKEAVLSLAREHIDKNGSLEGFEPPKVIGPNSTL